MGGEYLPPLRKGEVEIARISLESTTADQISVRARRVGERIRYRIVDEYEFKYVCHPASSDSPLSLRDLIGLMESASDGGSIIFPILAMNSRDSRSDELADVHHRHVGFLRRPRALLPHADRRLARRAGTGGRLMKPEPSKLARLVVAYYEKFGHYVPEAALRKVDAGELAVLHSGVARGFCADLGGWMGLGIGDGVWSARLHHVRRE